MNDEEEDESPQDDILLPSESQIQGNSKGAGHNTYPAGRHPLPKEKKVAGGGVQSGWGGGGNGGSLHTTR